MYCINLYPGVDREIDFQSKSMDWFLYDRDHRHKRVKSDVKLVTGFHLA